jgi:glycosyltransferase involved in cell wall biosynthesis
MGNDINSRKLVLSDTWYQAEFPDVSDALQDIVSPLIWKVARNYSFFRAVLFIIYGRNYKTLVTCWHGAGRFLVVLAAILNIRKVVLLEFIDFNYPAKPAYIAFPYSLIVKFILSPSMHRSALSMQVLTEWERPLMAERYAYPIDQIYVITWPLILGEVKTRSIDAVLPQVMVFSSGRAACDWDTLFAACEIGRWPLTVVCTGEDLPRVNLLNRNGVARVLSDIPKSEHDSLFHSATVYALCLKEATKSSGQIRLACSIEAGVPVVATDVMGLKGYLLDGVTAMAVAPSNALALSNAILKLIDSPQERQLLAVCALEYAQRFDRSSYIRQIIDLIQNSK